MPRDLMEMFEVFRLDPETGEERRVGQVQYAEDGSLSLLDVEPDIAAKLGEAIRSANRKMEIVELVPPEGAHERFQTAAKVTKRSDDDFFDALGRYIEKYYGFSLG